MWRINARNYNRQWTIWRSRCHHRSCQLRYGNKWRLLFLTTVNKLTIDGGAMEMRSTSQTSWMSIAIHQSDLINYLAIECFLKCLKKYLYFETSNLFFSSIKHCIVKILRENIAIVAINHLTHFKLKMSRAPQTFGCPRLYNSWTD